MEANVSDELIEAMARELAKADNIEICSDAIYALSSYGLRARALIPVIRAHLEPTSEMLAIGNEAVDTCTKVDPCDNPAKHIWADMLAASPIGEIG